jgi:hypothetical protein
MAPLIRTQNNLTLMAKIISPSVIDPGGVQSFKKVGADIYTLFRK